MLKITTGYLWKYFENCSVKLKYWLKSNWNLGYKKYLAQIYCLKYLNTATNYLQSN